MTRIRQIAVSLSLCLLALFTSCITKEIPTDSDTIAESTSAESRDTQTKDNPFIKVPEGRVALHLSDITLYDDADHYTPGERDIQGILSFPLSSKFGGSKSLWHFYEEDHEKSAVVQALAIYRVASDYTLDEHAHTFTNIILGILDGSDCMSTVKGTTPNGFDYIVFLLDDESREKQMNSFHTDYYHYARICIRLDECHVLSLEAQAMGEESYFREMIEGLYQIDWLRET